MSVAAEPRSLRIARRVSLWLDKRYLDPIVGLLLPEAGDLLTTGFGLYVVWAAWRERVPVPVLARMLLNLGIDALVGAVPLLGDIFDVVFKAHARNLALLEARLPTRQASRSDWAILVLGVSLVLAGVGAAITLLWYVLRLAFV